MTELRHSAVLWCGVELLRLAILLQEMLAMKIEDASLGKFSAERGRPMDKAIVDTSDDTFDDTI